MHEAIGLAPEHLLGIASSGSPARWPTSASPSAPASRAARRTPPRSFSTPSIQPATVAAADSPAVPSVTRLSSSLPSSSSDAVREAGARFLRRAIDADNAYTPCRPRRPRALPAPCARAFEPPSQPLQPARMGCGALASEREARMAMGARHSRAAGARTGASAPDGRAPAARLGSSARERALPASIRGGLQVAALARDRRAHAVRPARRVSARRCRPPPPRRKLPRALEVAGAQRDRGIRQVIARVVAGRTLRSARTAATASRPARSRRCSLCVNTGSSVRGSRAAQIAEVQPRDHRAVDVVLARQ